MSDFQLVRQPIFARSGDLVGYEIRFRDSADGRHAFAQSFLSGTFDLIRDDRPAFVACSREQFLEQIVELADPTSTIPLIPPTLRAEPEIIEAIERFRAAGGQLALDDVRDEPGPSEALLPLCDWVRVDVRIEDPVVLGRIADRILAVKPVGLVADHVYEPGQYEVAASLGFDAFEGTYFSRPEPLPAADLPSSTIAALRLLGQARDPNVHDRDLESSIATDPVLTFQLLRIVNSAGVGARGVSSIGHALRLIGRAAFLRWLSLAIAASRRATSGVDQHLVRQAVERARLCEQLAGSGRDAGTLFLVGLFSLLDSVFRIPLADLLARVPLADDAREALLERTGPYGQAVEFAESYELGLFENAEMIAGAMGVDPAQIGSFYEQAVAWADEMLEPMFAGNSRAA
jgi:EAL and modified HD-GYP domain-containing signal transduction protein